VHSQWHTSSKGLYASNVGRNKPWDVKKKYMMGYKHQKKRQQKTYGM
jgi:hypothetical protein